MNRSMWERLGLAGFLCAMAGCVQEPLSKPARADADRQLIGCWQAKLPDGDTAHLDFAEPTKTTFRTVLADQSLLVLTSYHRDAKSGRRYRLKERRVFVSTVEKNSFLNVYTEGSNAPEENGRKLMIELSAYYDIDRYQANGNTLDVWELDPRAIIAAIEKGTVEGGVQKDADGRPQIWALVGGDNLRKFLAGPGADDVFPAARKVTYTRASDKK